MAPELSSCCLCFCACCNTWRAHLLQWCRCQHGGSVQRSESQASSALASVNVPYARTAQLPCSFLARLSPSTIVTGRCLTVILQDPGCSSAWFHYYAKWAHLLSQELHARIALLEYSKAVLFALFARAVAGTSGRLLMALASIAGVRLLACTASVLFVSPSCGSLGDGSKVWTARLLCYTQTQHCTQRLLHMAVQHALLRP